MHIKEAPYSVRGVHKHTTPTPQASMIRCNMCSTQINRASECNSILSALSHVLSRRIPFSRLFHCAPLMPRFVARAWRPMSYILFFPWSAAAPLAAFLAALFSRRAFLAARVGEGRTASSDSESASEPLFESKTASVMEWRALPRVPSSNMSPGASPLSRWSAAASRWTSARRSERSRKAHGTRCEEHVPRV